MNFDVFPYQFDENSIRVLICEFIDHATFRGTMGSYTTWEVSHFYPH